MKKIITALTLAFAVSLVYAAGEPEKVCLKDAKGKEVCKTVIKHKKLEVPKDAKK